MTTNAYDKAYLAYPQEYFTILDKVETQGTYRVGPMTKSDALNGRRSFYHFRRTLTEEAQRHDPIACRYAPVASLLKIEIHSDEDTSYLVFTTNPIVAFVREEEQANG